MDHINEVLRLTSGNKTRAARILGNLRQGLIEKLRRLRIEDSSERTVRAHLIRCTVRVPIVLE
jgi:DNA-binding NtrC family response regulator